MYWMHYDETELARLRRECFTERQIARLYQLRRGYAQDEMDQPSLDRRCLEFVRFLVATGRLTEQCV